MNNKKVIIVLVIILLFILGCLGVKLFIDNRNSTQSLSAVTNKSATSKDVVSTSEEFNSDIEIIISELNKENSDSETSKNKDLSLNNQQSIKEENN